jgi:hypothetical protein
LAIVHDAAFAQRSATAALLGLISLAAFVLSYALVASRGWPPALATAWLAFGLGTALFALLTSVVHVPPVVGLAAACTSFAIAARAMPPGGRAGEWKGETAAPSPAASGEEGTAAPPASAAPPAWDLPVRALCAAAMVLAVTGISSAVGSRVAGLLAPAPIITSILAAFTHAQAGTAPALHLLRGMLTGFFAFAAFCFAVAVLLPHASIGVAFAVAAAVSVGTSALVARA